MYRRSVAITILASFLFAGCGRDPAPAVSSSPQDPAAATRATADAVPANAAAQGTETPEHTARGRVMGVDHSASTVTIAHEPVPSLGWPAMTMSFALADHGVLASLKEGDLVAFAFRQVDAGGYEIKRIATQK